MDKNKAILLGIIVVVIAIIVGIVVVSRKGGEGPAVDKFQPGTTQTGGQAPGTGAPTSPPSSSGQTGQTGSSSQESAEAAAAIKAAQSISNDLGGMNSSANQFNENEDL